jgi:hypothetical protein
MSAPRARERTQSVFQKSATREKKMIEKISCGGAAQRGDEAGGRVRERRRAR